MRALVMVIVATPAAGATIAATVSLCPDRATGCYQSTNSAYAELEHRTGSVGGARFDGTSRARADYGRLWAYAGIDVKDYAAGSYEFPSVEGGRVALNPAAANASFDDTFTITGGVGQALLRFRFLVDAAFYSSEDVVLGPYAFFDAAANGEAVSYFLTSSERAHVTVLAPFLFGVPFDVRASLEATLALFDGDFSSPYSYSGFADLGRAALEPLRVTTLDGQPITGWELATESGALYNVHVPEPGTTALVMAALAFLIARCQRR